MVRLDRALLQREVAREIGVSIPNIFNWETNRYQPATRFLPHIVSFLGYCPYTPPSSFGEWMKQCRTTMGLSQESLAQALSMDESTVASWERGERQPIQKSSEKAEAFFRSTK